MSTVLLAPAIGKIVHPLFIAFAWLLALFYSWIPNYAVAIMLLTLTVMIVVFPITRKGTRSMMKMQILAPEMKKLQARYKAPAGASAAERTEARQKLNEEMMALYKENGVSPTGGCVPMFLQFPAFIILYDTIRGLTHLNAAHHLAPLYVAHTTRMYHDIVTQNALQVRPHLDAFGLNLAEFMYKRDPQILASMEHLRARTPDAPNPPPRRQHRMRAFWQLLSSRVRRPAPGTDSGSI